MRDDKYEGNMVISKNWSAYDIPNLSGKTAIVTGGNKGLGYQSSLELARNGANVIISCRDVKSGLAAKDQILALVPNAKIDVLPLDLTCGTSIRHFSETFKQSYQRLDILICNAGVVNLDTYQLTAEGHEMHMATNHFGHFALTGLLLPVLLATQNSRVVVVSSLAYKGGKINYKDLNWSQREYSTVKSYADSKLANLLFVNHLNRFLIAKGASTIAVTAHPGLTGTERQQSIGIGGKLAKWLASSVEKGVLSQLLAATAPQVKALDFYGPKYGLIGKPVKINLKTLDKQEAEKLWQVSEKITGVSFQ